MEYRLASHRHINYSTVHTTLNTSGSIFTSDIIQLPWVRGILIGTFSMICVVGALGNALVLFYLYRSRRNCSLKSMRYLIMNLALCDFFTLAVYEPLRTVEIFLPFATREPVTTSLFYCRVCSYIGYVIYTVGYHTLVAISLERYLMICYPLKSKAWVSIGNTLKIITLVWILAFCCMLPVPLRYSIVSHGVLEDGTPLDFCMTEVFRKESHVSLSWKVYYPSMFVLYYGLPLFSMTCFYLAIFRTLNKNIGVHEGNDPNLVKMLQSRKILSKHLVMIAVVFNILHTPYFIGFLCFTFDAPLPDNPIFSLIMMELLLATNSMLNPFIYCAQSHSFFRRRMLSFLTTSLVEASPKPVRKSPHTTSLRQAENNNDTAYFGKTLQQEKLPLIGNAESDVWIRMKDVDYNAINDAPYAQSSGHEYWTLPHNETYGTRV